MLLACKTRAQHADTGTKSRPSNGWETSGQINGVPEMSQVASLNALIEKKETL